MDYTDNYIRVLQGKLAVPELKTRMDIWKYFPVAAKPIEDGVKDRLEWHISNMIKMSKQTKIKIDDMKVTLLPIVLEALNASKAWITEDGEGPNGVAILTYVKSEPARNKTQKNKNRRFVNVAPPVVQYRSWYSSAPIAAEVEAPKPKPLSENKTRRNKRNIKNTRRNANEVAREKNREAQAKLNENAFFARMAERTNEEKAANNLARRERMKKYIPVEAEHLKQIRQIVNKLTAENQEKLIQELVAVIPLDSAKFKESMDLFVDLALNTQAYHPLFIEVVKALPEEAPTVLAASYMSRFQKAFSDPAFLVPQGLQQTLNYRCYLLFAGYMYRESFLSWSDFHAVLRRLEELIEEDNPSIQNEAIQGLQYALIRGGKRMMSEGGEAAEEFDRYIEILTDLSKYYGVQRIRIQIQIFLDAVKADFRINPSDPWAVGAPSSNMKPKPKQVAPPVAPRFVAAPVAPAPKGLGSDISELWRRYPLDVKQQGDMWVVKFHNKKMTERYEKERRRFPTQAAMQEAFLQEIQSLVENSAVWSLGPSYPGALLTIVSKV